MTPYDDLPAGLLQELRSSGLDPWHLYGEVLRALHEDLPEGHEVDVTSAATIAPDAHGVGVFAAREEGVMAGLGVAELVFRAVLGDDVTIRDRCHDGTHVRPGDVVMTVTGPTRGLLTAERTALNYVTHLSGIATATAQWVAALEGTGAKVLDTRKTLPTYRALQKYAVRCGGGHNHRFSLADMALVKDNHVVAAGGVVPAYRAVRSAYPDLPVEVEVDSLDQLRELLEAGCDRILLDNMAPDTLREAVELTAGRAVLEASGGLTLERARAVAETGVDWISVGALTHSVKVFDIGLDLHDSHADPVVG
ncbi:carboxylating nicotinate-nucleotide diphosphorylase [Nocardioides sp. BP30]|uniref:carboxylating nicotinate-nucleotide diphosphorylase n=1 Tax=Nocardioides sp. BP30 TaxID=3036374 RepID=UPI0024689068|nr:carboxylating nicotinate-nucleotide diphosphorylase [Nocardioides sp. BP30]WGL52892.1 carboxylating nicotinate-nucleotide diphosphorylase [Nocardioides sp. BP30]